MSLPEQNKNEQIGFPYDVIVGMIKLDEQDRVHLMQSPLLPADIIAKSKTMTLKRQQQFLAGRFILATLLSRHWRCSKLPQIAQSHNGKPVFCDPILPNFNISHSGNWIAVAVSRNGNIGIDIEIERAILNRLTIARTFFSKEEWVWLTQQKNDIPAFWQLWTLRESALKLYGKGVWQMKQLSILPESMQVVSKFASVFYCHYQCVESVHLSLCGEYPIHTIHIEPISIRGEHLG